uniref:QVPTGV class sortase B protein-sorting domain-containing protein n=1 Tax=Faecalibaculum rodentium TaxID=1702221 RepID=UPI001F583852
PDSSIALLLALFMRDKPLTELGSLSSNKNGDIPTGILMSVAPYAGLVGLGGIFAGLFFRRKRED